LALGQRGTHLLSVDAHGLNPKANAGQALQSFRCLLEWQLGAGFGYPRLQLSTQDLVATQAEHLIGRDPATFTRWTPVVRSLEWRVTAHTDWLPPPPLVWPTPGTTLWTGRTLALRGRLIQAERSFQHRAQHRPHDASKDTQHTPLVLGQLRLPMLNSPLLKLLGGLQQPRYDR